MRMFLTVDCLGKGGDDFEVRQCLLASNVVSIEVAAGMQRSEFETVACDERANLRRVRHGCGLAIACCRRTTGTQRIEPPPGQEMVANLHAAVPGLRYLLQNRIKVLRNRELAEPRVSLNADLNLSH